jgi:mitotic spindle assembly checkpoint protein MAD2
VLLYTDKDAKAPETMAETDAKFIANSEDMRLRSFSTSVHEVSSMVSYKVDDD